MLALPRKKKTQHPISVGENGLLVEGGKTKISEKTI